MAHPRHHRNRRSTLAPTGAAAAFAPSDVSGLSLWLDASDSSTITLSGSDVVTWRDKTANDNDVTAGQSPSIATAAINGLDAITFATNEFLQSSGSTNLAGLDSFTYFCVGTTNVASGNRITAGLFGGSGTSWYHLIQDDETWRQIVSYNGSGEFAVTTTDTVQTDDTAFYVQSRIERDGNKGVLIDDGTEVTSAAPDAALFNSSGNLNIGGVASFFYNGKICEILFYNEYISDADIASVKSYLTTKWGV